MKIALFDGIVETHVGSSFERALIAAGHEVFNSGKIGHGYSFASDVASLRVIETALNQVLAFNPDVIFVFRPGSLPYPLLQRAKASGATLVAWFSDDPVLWNLSYGPVVDSYDLVLHCGTTRVLQFYEDMHGRPTGVNFPFWTDELAFPYVYGEHDMSHDAIFLGNVHDEVRRRRYFDLGSLESNVRIYGNVGRDYYGIWGGYLDSDNEVVEAGKSAGVAINIPQYFRDHHGLDTWFKGLGDLGYFQYPSRVIQYAAMGLPIVSVVPDLRELETFPEIVCVSDIDSVDSTIKDMLNGNVSKELSLATHKRFLSSYTAKSRVMALESLLVDDSWKKLDATERSSWFSQFDANSEVQSLNVLDPGRFPAVDIVPIRQADPQKLRIAIIGKDFDRVTSISSVAGRAFTNLGHVISIFGAEDLPSVLVDSDSSGYSYRLRADNFVGSVEETVDILVIAGLECEISQIDAQTFRSLGIKVAYIGCTSSKNDDKLELLASKVDYLGLLNSDVAEEMGRIGYQNTDYLPYLVDNNFIAEVAQVELIPENVLVSGNRKLHFMNQATAFKDIGQISKREFYLEDLDPALSDLQLFASSIKSEIAVVSFNSSVAGPLPSEVLPFVLASGALTFVPRGVGPMNISVSGVASVSVRERGELALKMADLEKSEDRVSAILGEAKKLVETELNAEYRYSRMLDILEITPDGDIDTEGADADVLSFDSAALSFRGRIPDANFNGTCVDIVIAPIESLVSHDQVEVVITVDGLKVYSEVLTGGQPPVRLSFDFVNRRRNIALEIRQNSISGYVKYQKPRIIIESLNITKPSAPIKAFQVKSSSVWGVFG